MGEISIKGFDDLKYEDTPALNALQDEAIELICPMVRLTASSWIKTATII